MNHQAAVVRNVYFPGQMIIALGLDGTINLIAARLFLEQFRHDAGASEDPVERLLLDQLALAHLRLGRLQAQAEQAQQLEFKKLYLDAVARLLGEVSKMALVLPEYRRRSRSRQRRKATAPSTGHCGQESKGGV